MWPRSGALDHTFGATRSNPYYIDSNRRIFEGSVGATGRWGMRASGRFSTINFTSLPNGLDALNVPTNWKNILCSSLNSNDFHPLKKHPKYKKNPKIETVTISKATF